MSETEKNPLKAIRKLKELSRSLAADTHAHEGTGKKSVREKNSAKKHAEKERVYSFEGEETGRKPAGAGKAAGRAAKRTGKETGAAEAASLKKAGTAKKAAKAAAGTRKAAAKSAPETKKAAVKDAPETKRKPAAKKTETVKKTETLKKAAKKAAAKRNRSPENGVPEMIMELPVSTAAEMNAETGKKAGSVKNALSRKGSRSSAAEGLVEAVLSRAEGIRRKNGAKVKIIPLGGLEQIGMNITAFEYGDSIMVVDCGMAFPGDDMLGIDCVIPDVTYLKENASKVKGFVITHGHEDHIGALPYILKELNVPVYSTRLTIALIRHKLEEHGLADSAKLFVVKHGDTVPLGEFNVEFVKTNHSISDSSALAISCPAGVIFHTGDFKIDYTPVFGEAADLQRMAELGKKGVLALLCDSTNAVRPGFTMSERTVGRTFDLIFSEHQENRIIVATFASNVDRVQQVINTAYKYGRKVVVEGRSMVNVIGIANELGYIHIPEGTLIDIEQLKNYPPEKTVLITTGSQGESMAALSRMAGGMHRKVSITPNDVVIMSSHPIPGNEKAVDKVINELSIKGAEVVFQDTHVSGHACAEEIKLMYSLLRPKFAIPVHGEYRHRKAQVAIAEAVGVPKENILFMSSGDVVELSEDSCRIAGRVQAGGILVQGLGVGDVGNVVLKDRQNLGANGIMVVTMVFDRATDLLVSGPEIVSRGVVYMKDSEDVIDDARAAAQAAVTFCEGRGITDWSRIRNEVREALSDYFWKKMKRNPVIIPIIMGVN